MNKLLFALIFLTACQTKQPEKAPATAGTVKVDSVALQKRQDSLAIEEENAVQQGKYKTWWGYRFHIQGDFDGDGKEEVLTEKLISTRTGKEIGKFCGLEKDTIPDCYWTARVNTFRQPKCVLKCSNPKIGDFTTTRDSAGTIGMAFLQNAGDLNGDGTDEMAFVEDLGGCNSGIREVLLATYKKGKWVVLIKSETRMENDFSWDERIATPEDLNKPIVKTFEKELMDTPPFFKKEKDKVVYEDYEAATLVTKHRKIDW
ncbi:MAG TPA: hypothetical protein PLM41_15730 [Saprospiraceae bacterium]|nr:hypothetical protein [Saprospiraceae bacterium]